jgi:Leu/Phe-tRNA-protein transferase
MILVFGTPSLVMNRRMLDVLKKCAEGRQKEPGQWVRRLLS